MTELDHCLNKVRDVAERGEVAMVREVLMSDISSGVSLLVLQGLVILDGRGVAAFATRGVVLAVRMLHPLGTLWLDGVLVVGHINVGGIGVKDFRSTPSAP